jgi:porphobilinogen deaminase
VKLITLQAPGGGSIYVCRACNHLMDAGRLTIRDHRGQQYCQTERGLTTIADAHCDACAMIHACTSKEEKRLLLRVNTIDQITAQRDALLEACKALQACCDKNTEAGYPVIASGAIPGIDSVYYDCCAAIALCEGGAK